MFLVGAFALDALSAYLPETLTFYSTLFSKVTFLKEVFLQDHKVSPCHILSPYFALFAVFVS